MRVSRRGWRAARCGGGEEEREGPGILTFDPVNKDVGQVTLVGCQQCRRLGGTDLELLHHGRDQKLHHRGAGGQWLCRIGLDGVDNGGLNAHVPERCQPPGPCLLVQTARVLWRTRWRACPLGLFLGFLCVGNGVVPDLALQQALAHVLVKAEEGTRIGRYDQGLLVGGDDDRVSLEHRDKKVPVLQPRHGIVHLGLDGLELVGVAHLPQHHGQDGP